MSGLASLVERSRAQAEGDYREAGRMMGICNSCRYCEGYCAVFPSMERRLAFDAPALDYLANLCHHCGACLYACQYAPPHEFGVNIPQALAGIRRRSFERFAWPRATAPLYRHPVAVALWSAVAASVFFIALIAFTAGPARLVSAVPGASFYAVLPHGTMVGIFGAAFVYAIAAMAVGGWRFREALGPGDLSAGRASVSAARLANLEGGGEGCYQRSGLDHPPSAARRWLHHSTFYGFLLCLASTSLATIEHYVFHRPAPYPFASAVVLLGTLGGIGLAIGPVGLLALRRTRDERLVDRTHSGIDGAFLWLLLAVSATGLAVLAWRSSAAMPMLLAVHMGCVLAFFLTMPYGKFVHAVYRFIALARHEREAREPNPFASAEGQGGG